MKTRSNCFYAGVSSTAAALAGCFSLMPSAMANPAGAVVTQGTATVNSQGSTLTVQTGGNAVINWSSFNIGAGETTTFVQPSASSVVWNQINDSNPSQILGTLNANGYVVLQNQSGFYIGGQAVLNTHGLIMTTASTPPPDIFSGGAWQFNAPPPTADIINYGRINTSEGGFAFLIANNIENHGEITAPGGNIGLYSGKEVLLSSRPDGRGLSAAVTLPQGSVDNSGKLIADAGTIALNAQVVNQGGLIQANSVKEHDGVIDLVAGDSLNLASSSLISAKGDASGTSSGGSVTLKAANLYADASGSVIDISGGAQGGNAGSLEISAPRMNNGVQSDLKGSAASGWVGGSLTLDPAYIDLVAGSGSSGSGSSADDPLLEGVGLFTGMSQISVVASQNIEMGTQWSLATLGTPSLLSLTAGDSIIMDNGSSILAGANWSVSLAAGPQNLAAKPAAGDGIYLNGNSFIQTQDGNISLWAANEVIVNSGAIRTAKGGSIGVTAEFGDVNSGNNSAGYLFAPAKSVRNNAPPYYTVSTALGGISTEAGGDVSITAGGNVTSFLPVGTDPLNAAGDAGSGAFGSQAGNVTIKAGGNVAGHYVLANGVGSISAGGDVGVAPGIAGSAGAFALSLIKGNWNVSAPNGSVYVQDIRNPNGIFNDVPNDVQGLPYSGYHFFDYDPFASVTLSGGNTVEITGDNLPHSSSTGFSVPMILPPSLTVSAGAGGFLIGADVYLFPSADGELNISTHNGGGFSSYLGPNDPAANHKLVMSDSGATQWTSDDSGGVFDENHHAATPPEMNNQNPVVVYIDGSINNLLLRTTKETEVTVNGDVKNFSLLAENLHAGDATHPADVSYVNVAGKISYSPVFSFVPSSQPISSADPVLPGAWDSIFSLLVDPTDVSLKITDPTILGEINNGTITPAALTAYAFKTVNRIDLQPGHPLAAGYDPTADPGFIYDAVGKQLGYQFQMSQLVLKTLTQVDAQGNSAIPVLKLNAQGQVQVEQRADGSFYFATTTVGFSTPSVINALYTQSLNAVTGATPGFEIGGPGKFNISASSIDLGSSSGIVSWGIGSGGTVDYSSLKPYTPVGAQINVTTPGDLSLLTSRIASVFGGDVNVTSGGSVILSQGNFALIPPGATIAYGIFTSGLSDVNVTANQDVDIGGARIATFNGGNVTITSENGSVNAGNGANFVLVVPVIYRDPITGELVNASIADPRPYGSGVLAMVPTKLYQAPGSDGLPGNITINTPHGDIISTLGGIQQVALDGSITGGPVVNLSAGTKQVGKPGDADYVPEFVGNVDLGQGGVIGGTINITAEGSIKGLILSHQNANINAAQSFSGTLLSGGIANVTATAGSISGTIVGIGGVNASGGTGVSALVLGQNVNIGNAGPTSTLGTSANQGSAATAAGATATDEAKSTVSDSTQGDDDLNKPKKSPLLVRLVKRVTVLLPKI